jgi:hypothetical protein
MKIDNAASTNMLHQGPIENAQKYAQSKETERLQTATEMQSTTSVFMDDSIKGSVFDAKA